MSAKSYWSLPNVILTYHSNAAFGRLAFISSRNSGAVGMARAGVARLGLESSGMAGMSCSGQIGQDAERKGAAGWARSVMAWFVTVWRGWQGQVWTAMVEISSPFFLLEHVSQTLVFPCPFTSKCWPSSCRNVSRRIARIVRAAFYGLASRPLHDFLHSVRHGERHPVETFGPRRRHRHGANLAI